MAAVFFPACQIDGQAAQESSRVSVSLVTDGGTVAGVGMSVVVSVDASIEGRRLKDVPFPFLYLTDHLLSTRKNNCQAESLAQTRTERMWK